MDSLFRRSYLIYLKRFSIFHYFFCGLLNLLFLFSSFLQVLPLLLLLLSPLTVCTLASLFLLFLLSLYPCCHSCYLFINDNYSILGPLKKKPSQPNVYAGFSSVLFFLVFLLLYCCNYHFSSVHDKSCMISFVMTFQCFPSIPFSKFRVSCVWSEFFLTNSWNLENLLLLQPLNVYARIKIP